MKTTVEFLNAVMQKHGIKSDNQLSIFLGCTRSAISGYRHKKTFLDDRLALKVADSLEIEPGYVLACIAAERSKDERVKKAWAWWADHKSLAAALAVLAVLPFAPWIDQDSLSGIALLGLEGGYVLACIAAERSKNERVKKAWAWWADHKSLAAALAVLALLPFAPWIDQDSLSGIALLGLTAGEGRNTAYYVKLLATCWPLLPPSQSSPCWLGDPLFFQAQELTATGAQRPAAITAHALTMRVDDLRPWQLKFIGELARQSDYLDAGAVGEQFVEHIKARIAQALGQVHCLFHRLMLAHIAQHLQQRAFGNGYRRAIRGLW